MSKIKIGDRVQTKGLSPDDSEYDTGTAVEIHGDIILVEWNRAADSYDEDVLDLELIDA